MYGGDGERTHVECVLYVTLRVSVQAAGPAFEPNVDPLAGFGLSIRDQRRTSNERPMEDNKREFPRIQQSLFKVPRRKPRN